MSPDLHGVGVLVTRPEQQAGPLCAALRQAGASVFSLPAIDIAEHPALPDTRSRLRGAGAYDLIVCVSANAVRFGSSLLEARRGATLAAVGPATARALEQLGYRVGIVPSGGFDSEHLLAELSADRLRGKRVLLIKGGGGRDLLQREILSRGAAVDIAEVYERRAAKPSAQAIASVLGHFESGDIQLITATSLEIAQHLLELDPLRLRPFFERAVWVVPGERVAAGLRLLGPGIQILSAASAEDQDLVRAISDWRSRLSGA